MLWIPALKVGPALKVSPVILVMDCHTFNVALESRLKTDIINIKGEW